jgi:hypothetical protein
MPTQCNPERLVFAPVEGRSVVASFTGGAITSDAGGPCYLEPRAAPSAWSSASPRASRMPAPPT